MSRVKTALEALQLLRRALLDRHDLDSLCGERGPKLALPELRLSARQLRHACLELGERLGRRQPVGRADRESCRLLAHQAGHADHEELVEVGGEDRAELHALEQRLLSSQARSRTRALNSTHDSSRLRRRESAVTVRVGIGSNTIRRSASARRPPGANACYATSPAQRVDQPALEMGYQPLRLGHQGARRRPGPSASRPGRARRARDPRRRPGCRARGSRRSTARPCPGRKK